MVWKLVPIDNVGQPTVYGGDDLKKVMKYLSGYDLFANDASDRVDIANRTTFASEQLRIKSPTTGFSYIIKGSEIVADRILTLPLMAADGTVALTASGTTTDWGAFMQTFRNSNIQFRNPANTFNYIWVTSAITANRNITLPLLTTDDTVVFASATQSLANKTLVSPTISAMNINTDSNTIKHSTTNNSGDLLVNTGTKFDRFQRGAANQVPIMNASGTGLSWIDKANLGTGGGGGGGGTGDFAVPIVDNTITGAWYATNPEAGAGVWSDFLVDTSSVTPTRPADLRMNLVYTLTGSGDDCGFRTDNVHFCRGNNPEIWFRYALVSSAPSDLDYRVAVGFSNNVDSDFGTDNALDGKNGVLWYKETADANIQVATNDGDTTTNKDPTLNLPATNNSINTIRLFGDDTNNRFGVSLNGGTAQYYSNEIPAQSTKLGCVVMFENSDSTTRTFYFYGAYFRAKVI